MKTSSFCRAFVLLVPVVISSFFAGCKILPEAAADPTRYYVLTGPAADVPGVAKPAGKHQIGLRPVELPGYLHNRKDIVVRSGLNEIRFQDFARWAEPLEAGVNRVLRERLLADGAVGGVTPYPFSVDVKRDYDVVVRVLRCEGVATAGGKFAAQFEAGYDIVAAGGAGEVVARRRFAAPEQAWDGADFSALAALLSEAVARLSEDIAAHLPK